MSLKMDSDDSILLEKDTNLKFIDAEKENAGFSAPIEQSTSDQNNTKHEDTEEAIQSRFHRKFLHLNMKLDSSSVLDDAAIKKMFVFLVKDWKTNCTQTNHRVKNMFRNQIVHLLNDRKRPYYHHFACEVIFQFVNEWLNFNMSHTEEGFLKRKEVAVDVLETDPDNLDVFFNPLNENHRQLIQLVVVFCSSTCELHETLIETDDKLKLLYYLRLGRFASFETTIVGMLQRKRKEVGNFGRVALEPIVKFHMIIAEKLRLYNFSKLLRRHFPQLDESWTWTIDCNRLQSTIKNKFENDLEEIEKESNIKTKKMRGLLNQLLTLKKFPIDTFLRVGENRKTNLLESILSFPGLATKDKDYIKIVLARLNLSKTPEVLQYVSNRKLLFFLFQMSRYLRIIMPLFA